jgi:hypothetical protein
MLTLVHLSTTAVFDPSSMAAVAGLARKHHLVVVCAQHRPGWPVLPALRAALRGRHCVGLVVNGEVGGADRRLVERLLDEGKVVVIITGASSTAAQLVNWLWLPADSVLTLPVTAG